MAIELRPIEATEVRLFRRVIGEVFGHDPPTDAEVAKRKEAAFIDLVDLARTYVAFEEGELVGAGASFDFELTVPGSTLEMGGLTMVAVRPTHRRRGILRRIIEAHFDDVRRRGEALTGLWSSESSIYGRFGYGRVGDSDALEFSTASIEVSRDLGSDGLHVLDLERAAAQLPAIYDAVRLTRPGMLNRTDKWWEHRIFSPDRPAPTGATKLRVVVSQRGGVDTGYVIYRQRAKLDDNTLFAGTVEVFELVATDGVAEASLWRYLSNVDLFPNVKWWNAPSDSILSWIVGDSRRIIRRRIDHLWLRVDDVAKALCARRYLCDGELRMQVEDTTYQLEVSDGAGHCEPTDRAPEITCDRAALGSVYLGGIKPSVLHRAGLISGDRLATERADRLLAWGAVPWCAEVF